MSHTISHGPHARALGLLEALVRLETQLWNETDRALAAEGAHRLGTVLALRAIASHEGSARAQELRLDLGITIGAASKIVDRLHAEGLAERAPHPTDGRSSVLSLTAAGESALARATAIADAAARRAIGERSEDASSLLGELLGVERESAG